MNVQGLVTVASRTPVNFHGQSGKKMTRLKTGNGMFLFSAFPLGKSLMMSFGLFWFTMVCVHLLHHVCVFACGGPVQFIFKDTWNSSSIWKRSGLLLIRMDSDCAGYRNRTKL